MSVEKKVAKKKKVVKKKEEKITIAPLNKKTVVFDLIGFSPLVMHARPKTLLEDLAHKAITGETKKRAKRNLKEEFENGQHVSADGWIGIPTGAFKGSMVGACRLTQLDMIKAKMLLEVIPDGYSKIDFSGLVKLKKAKPHYTEKAIPNGKGATVLTVVTTFDPEWECTIKIRYDADVLDASDVANLVQRAGDIGILSGRANAPKGCGMGWGKFKIKGT